MSRKKPDPPKPDPVPPPPAEQSLPRQLSVINLKGSQEQIDWLDEASRDTKIPKSAIVRLGLTLWGKANKRKPFPESEDRR